LGEDNYRYRSWKVDAPQDVKPDLTPEHGECDQPYRICGLIVHKNGKEILSENKFYEDSDVNN
jgi:hypothetical protein